MSYIDKEKLIKADIASIENRVRHAFNQGYNLGFKDGKERAKPLEQEPVIDKIRAEIMQLDYDTESVDYDYNDMAQTEEVHTIYREEVLQILDKHKAESEG